MRILLLEDDIDIARWISDGLTRAGHAVDHLSNGREALIAGAAGVHDIMILDRMTPELDGLSVLKSLRAAQISTPVLFLTALGEIEHRVEGLEAGADDYLSKPFAMSELIARIGALGRRAGPTDGGEATVLSAGELSLDLIRRRCTRRDEVIELNSKEFALLEVFLRNPGRVMTRNMLLEKVWSMHFDPATSVVETHMSRLRAKIEKPFGDTVIRTVRGAGYVLETG